ncbi:hypothetical protein HQ531_12000, partial [bacterium]|nr:hypothetical protein [bacterium]
VWQEDETGNQDVLNLIRNEAGFYNASLSTKFPGETQIIAEAYRFGELWGRDTSTIHLVAFNGEDRSEGVDEVFLSRLAARSKGEIIKAGINEMPVIPAQNYEQKTAFHLRGVYTIELFVILLTLLVLEWILRRRLGLL